MTHEPLTADQDVSENSQRPNILLFPAVSRTFQNFRCRKAVEGEKMSCLDQVRRFERIDSLEGAGESIEEPAVLDVGGTSEIN